MNKTRDPFAFTLACVATAASCLVLLLVCLLQGWWMLLFVPAASGALLGLAGVGTYRLD